MNNKQKYTLTLLAVLIIGMILGFLINGRLVHRRVDRLQEYFTERGFGREFMMVLNPSPEQMEKIRPILKDYALKNHKNMMQYREGQAQLMQNLQKDLKPYLNPDQIRRLSNLRNRWDRRFWWHRQMRMRMHRGGPGMGPGGPPNDSPGGPPPPRR
jgi:hypothetical protein